MYRLVLWLLIILYVVAFLFSFLKFIPFNPIELSVSLVVLLGSCYISNHIFSRIFKAPTNLESLYITALILALIVSPSKDPEGIFELMLLGVIAMASKYIMALKKKHIFNPAAIAVVASSLFGLVSASWWIGNYYMAPFLILAGILIVRKIRFSYMVYAFFAVYMTLTLSLGILSGIDSIAFSQQIFLNSHLLFFAFVMLTEPITLPPARKLKILYGGLIGLLSVPQFHLGNYYLMPEHALVIGNAFSFILSFKRRVVLDIKERNKLSKYAMELVFNPVPGFSFKPGQYMEWTLPHHKPDSRGTRRFFTIASSPTEKNIKLGINFAGEEGSSYKRFLENYKGRVSASNLDGGFIMPEDDSKKLAFIAGGIGITPFRSMIKYLIDKNEKRDVILIYSNSNENEISYKEIFDQASKVLGTKIVYTLSKEAPLGWKGRKGRVDENLIREEIPDFNERIFYVSGSQPLINRMKQVLNSIGVPRSRIKTDYFPGLT